MISPAPPRAPGHVSDHAIGAAAARLLRAQLSHTPCAPVRDLIGAEDLSAAYAVQARLTSARTAAGATVVGRKIGLTSPAVQTQFGVNQPDFGVLFDDMDSSGTAVPVARLLQPKAEAEIAFVLSDDLVDRELLTPRHDLGAEEALFGAMASSCSD